ncbi:amidase [Aeromicrobium sp. CF3.5]|uniref:amidase n=1 Tax=Aeromicrobium sp. CF3.5 TaxID=3373078 RepID=UPI003EE508FB
MRRGRLRAVDVAQAHLTRWSDDRTNAVLGVDRRRVMAQAAAVDASADRDTLPLAGVPVIVKDNIDVGGEVTAAGSAAHDGVPAAADSVLVARLRAAGAVLVGRANMDELAMGASTQTSAHGPTRNPVDHRRSPGGSSGGCAAAVAGHVAPLAVGTDTGGSIREPASQCGVLGMAPSPGLVPMGGVLPFMPQLDRAGPLARSAEDLTVLLDVLSGGSIPNAQPVRRVGVVAELVGSRNQADVTRLFTAWLRVVASTGVEIVTVSVPDAPHALDAYMTTTSVAALDWLDPWLASGRAGEEVVRRADYGARLLEGGGERVAWAEHMTTRVREQVADALTDVDVLVSPTMPTVAPLLVGPVTPEELADPLAAPYTDCWTVVANLAGVPALSVPMATDGLPIGAMLMGRPGGDAALLDLAIRVHRALSRHPSGEGAAGMSRRE